MEKDSYSLQNTHSLLLAFQEHRLQHPSWRPLLRMLPGTRMFGIIRKGKSKKTEIIMVSLYGSMAYLECCVPFFSSQFGKDMVEPKGSETQQGWSLKWKD